MVGQIITFKRVFSAAHRLYPYTGKCANIHGHNYHVEVTISAEPQESTGFIVEFDDVKMFIDQHDHALLLSKDDPLYEVLDTQQVTSLTIVTFDFIPTTENLARHFAVEIKCMVDQVLDRDDTEVAVDLRETDSITAGALAR